MKILILIIILLETLQHKLKSLNDPSNELYQNWGQFFSQKKEQQGDVNFFINNEYEVLLINQQELLKLPSIDQSLIPPGNKFFWFLVNKQGVYVMSSKINTQSKQNYNLQFQNINPKDISDLGNFDEGYCTQLESNIEKMVVCFTDKMESAKFLYLCKYFAQQNFQDSSKLINFQAQLQDSQRQYLKDYKNNGPEGQKIQFQIEQNQFQTQNKEKESRWVVLQDWSTCSLACGGGTQTRQLQCQLGLEQKSCQGESIQKRNCNEQPCLEDSKAEILPLKVKSYLVSKRPQREERCVIKEGDLELVRDDLQGFARAPRMPIRAVMNNKTFIIFANENFSDTLFESELQDLNCLQDKKEEMCMVIANQKNGQIRTLCSLPNTQNLTPKQNIQIWQNAINLFKYDCQEKIEDNKIEENDFLRLKQQEIENEKRESQIYFQLDPSAEIKKNFKEIEQNTVNAIVKEMKFENLAEQEAVENIQNDQKQMRLDIEKARECEEILDRQKVKQEMQQRVKMEKNGIEQQVQQIKDSIKDMILEQRNKQQNKIKLIRDLSIREKFKDEQELQKLKNKMKNNLYKSYKKGQIFIIKGDKSNCIKNQLQQDIDLYCNKNIDDPDENMECKNPKEFCFVCCDNEFGGFNTDQRVDCFKDCQFIKKS